jgi:mRNA export factor
VLPDQSVHPFHEAFSSLSWAPNSFTLFATTAWDGEVRVFEVVNGAYSMAIVQKFSYKFPSPALKCTWNDLGNQLYIGFMDGSIKAYDFGSNQIQDVGRQNEAISSLHYIPGSNALISSGYEPTINIWQIGCPTPALTINANYTVYTSEFQFPLLVAGTAQEKNMFIDITNPNTRTFIESSDLGKNSQIQSLALSNKADLVGIATFDGRANISNVIKNHQSQYSTVSEYSNLEISHNFQKQ